MHRDQYDDLFGISSGSSSSHDDDDNDNTDIFNNPIAKYKTNTPAPTPAPSGSTRAPPSSQQLEELRNGHQTPVAQWETTEVIDGLEVVTPHVGTVVHGRNQEGHRTVTLTPIKSGLPVVSPTSPSTSTNNNP